MDRILKKPKVEDNEEGEKESREEDKEQEEALVALIEHRTKEVEHVKQKISYYQSQLEQAEKRLNDSQSKLARLRSRDSLSGSKKGLEDNSRNVKEEPKTPIRNLKEEPKSPSPISNEEGSSRKLPQVRYSESLTGSKKGLENSSRNVKEEPKSPSLVSKGESSSRKPPQARPQLIIPAVNPKISQPIKSTESNIRSSVGSGSRASVSLPTQSNGAAKIKEASPAKPSNLRESGEVQAKGTKRKFEQKEHKELISLIRSGSSPCMIRCQPGVHISSQHKRKLRCLELCPTNDQLFCTSSLDGIVNLWQVHGRGTGASCLSSTDCVSKQRRWPEDVAWHPQGDKLFCVYTADAGDSQISILNLNTTQKGKRVTYLDEKPHVKGIINNISFMPWADTCFVTGGSDHAVILWTEKDDENAWKYKALHRTMHSSAVMGVAGLQQKSIVLSVGADKRIIGFDMSVGRADFKHQLDCKCMSVVPNPSDFNLFMVQTGTHERQLRLFDIRLRQTEIHSFGWKQESSESQSALINQAWSPDGLYISSGSADPIIHIFDIRYNSHKPSQSINAHQKRVFKAAWMQSPPLLISISSDLNIGLHKIT